MMLGLETRPSEVPCFFAGALCVDACDIAQTESCFSLAVGFQFTPLCFPLYEKSY